MYVLKNVLRVTVNLSPPSTTMYTSKDEVQQMIDAAMAKHNRTASLISMILGFITLALFLDGLLRMMGIVPPFMGIDVDIIDNVVDKVKESL